jgi:hypothetical protein
MRRSPIAFLLAGIMSLAAGPAQLAAQQHAHDAMAAHHGASSSDVADAGRLGGQAAFATIAEVVRLLEADSTTDWTRVSIERLRAHLADMDAVTLRAAVTREDVDGGARFVVRGDPSVRAAARRMASAHAAMLRAERGWETSIDETGAAVRISATAGGAADVQRIRALGLVGLLATGEHHASHHVAIARGDGVAHD